jgi:hypothetical protein
MQSVLESQQPMSTQLNIFDICAGKHGGSPESKAANLRVQPHKNSMRGRVLELLKAKGERGATSQEIALELRRPLHTISGRVTELLAAELAYKTEITRDGGRVVRAL